MSQRTHTNPTELEKETENCKLPFMFAFHIYFLFLVDSLLPQGGSGWGFWLEGGIPSQECVVNIFGNHVLLQ